MRDARGFFFVLLAVLFACSILPARVEAAAGDLDPTFDVDGRVITNFPIGGVDAATAVAIQSDGKVVVAGWARSDFAVVRYHANGAPDTGFGSGGIVTTDFFGGEDLASGIAIQGDGKLVVVGTATEGVGMQSRRHAAIARYTAAGLPDPSFGSSGTVTVEFVSPSLENQANAVAIQPLDGKIIVVGKTFNQFTTRDFALARLDTGGALDASFGSGGIVTTDFNGGLDLAQGVAIQPDGKIVVAGSHAATSNVELHVDFALARYNGDGTLDTGFGSGTGKVTTAFQGVDVAHGVALQADCKIVAAGYSERVSNGLPTGEWDFALARYDGGVCPVAAPATCPRTQGYWKTHAADWPVTWLTLGSQSYGQAELLALLNTAGQTDASLTLGRQLIVAKLNIASGTDPSPVASTIVHADGLLSGFGGTLPYKVKPASPTGQAMIADATALESYNRGLVTPGCNP